jgi:hypothetical protein
MSGKRNKASRPRSRRKPRRAAGSVSIPRCPGRCDQPAAERRRRMAIECQWFLRRPAGFCRIRWRSLSDAARAAILVAQADGPAPQAACGRKPGDATPEVPEPPTPGLKVSAGAFAEIPRKVSPEGLRIPGSLDLHGRGGT